MEIIKYPHKILRTGTKKVKNISSPEIRDFIKAFEETMVKEDGLGLAANQVNKTWRILAVNYNNQPKVFINPRIYFKSFKKEVGEEGCLSFPGVFGLIKRSVVIRLFYRDEQDRLRHLKARGLMARVLQHEIDHLKGILFIDKILKFTKGKEKAGEWQKNAGFGEK